MTAEPTAAVISPPRARTPSKSAPDWSTLPQAVSNLSPEAHDRLGAGVESILAQATTQKNIRVAGQGGRQPASRYATAIYTLATMLADELRRSAGE